MGRNLYEVLRTTKHADLDAIRAQFRKIAKEVHPDHGGDADAFSELERAYRVLSDPEARKRYDATGEVPERSADNDEAAALGIIGSMLVSIIGSPHCTSDPVVAMRHSLAQNIQQAEKTIGELQRSVLRCERLSERFKTKRERDPIRDMIGAQIANMRTQIENHRQAIVTMERAQAILTDYSFEGEAPGPHEQRSLTLDEFYTKIGAQQAAGGFGFWGR